jgi:hypothetical protein
MALWRVTRCPTLRAGSRYKQVHSLVFNVFRRRANEDLCCAIRLERPLPAFINEAAWEYVGFIGDNDEAPIGFLPQAAWYADQLIGFYVFYLFAGLPRRSKKAA